jgi:hypothetical protein
MPRYLVLAPTWLRARGEGMARRYEGGEEIVFDGTPNVTLAPLDREAHEVRAATVRARRGTAQLDDRRYRRNLARVNDAHRAKIAAAAAVAPKPKGDAA